MSLLLPSSPAIHRFTGTLIGPDDDGYDTARRVYNGMVDRYPAHPLSAEAYRWLIRHVSSSEARRPWARAAS